METLKSVWRGIDRGLFGATSPTAMALMRILMGGLAFLALCQILPNFASFYTQQGIFPVEFAQRWSGETPRWNPLVWWPSAGLTVFVFGLTMVAALMTCVGLFTQVSSIVLFLGTVALHHRTPDILNSGDTLMRQYLFLLCLAPGGAVLSVDRWWGLKRGTASREVQPVSIWPQRLMQFQLAVVYFMTVWWKMGGDKWRDGTATWYPPRLSEFDRFPYPQFVDEMPFVLVSTYGTLIVELALATLVFSKPLRKYVVAAGVLMHGWIEYSMNIPFFSAIIVSSYIVYFEGDEVDRWLGRLSARFGDPSWLGWAKARGEAAGLEAEAA